MLIAKDSVVSLEYTLRSDAGETLDSSAGEGPLVYLHGYENIVPGLERQLAGKQKGDALQVSVSPEEGYGPRDPRKTMEVPRSQLPPGAPQVGMMLRGQSQAGDIISLWITAVGPDSVTVDGNHPMAGRTLHFDVTVLDVRVATDEERAHGHVHGPGGHH